MIASAPTPRRWPIGAIACLLVLVVLLAITLGAARSTADAASTAAQLATQRQYGSAVAMYRAIAQRTGPLFLFDQNDVKDAELNAQRTMLAWADALQKAGNADAAVALTRGITDPTLAGTVREEESSLLLAAAQSAAARGDYATALGRLQQLTAPGLANAGSTGQVAKLQNQYLVAEAQAQLAAGDGISALSTLDKASQQGSAGAGAAAPIMPLALLTAGQQEIDAAAYAEAAVTLQRVVASYGGSAEARQARGLLGAGQPVTGTLVDRGGHPLNSQVRLSSHFFSEPGGYLTSGPFYYTHSDSDGNFRFDSIPVGGPYVFEIFSAGDWVTFVDPNTGQPANPVSVSALTPVDLAFITLS